MAMLDGNGGSVSLGDDGRKAIVRGLCCLLEIIVVAVLAMLQT